MGLDEKIIPKNEKNLFLLLGLLIYFILTAGFDYIHTFLFIYLGFFIVCALCIIFKITSRHNSIIEILQ